MPPRGRKRRGKELVAAVATDAPGDAAAAVSPEYVEAVVAELEHESERRVKKLKRQMGDMRQEFLNHFQVELLKIPRKIREMKVEHFSSEYGGSMEEALKKAAQWEVEKVAPTPRPRGVVAATPRGGHAALARVAATPAHLRAPRAGETIMSVNGSPLAAVPMSTAKLAATIKVKGPKSKLPGAAADRPALLVELPSADGCVALNDSETLASLRSDPTMTADAMAHLTALQGEISKVMKTLQTAK
jgi:DNA-binding HxlR family transcriptional regulator